MIKRLGRWTIAGLAIAVVAAAVPSDATARDATDLPTPAEKRFGAALAAAIATDTQRHPPRGRLARVVVRWFDPAQPGYFTVHVLGQRERRRIRDADAWYPLEWPNLDREVRRTDRVTKAVRAAARTLKRRYARRPSAVPDEITAANERLAPPAILSALRRLPKQLRLRGLPVTGDFSMSATHLEGDGGLATLRALGPRRLLNVLKRRGELPFA